MAFNFLHAITSSKCRLLQLVEGDQTLARHRNDGSGGGRAPNDRAVDHGSVGRWSHGTLLARLVSHCRGLDRLQQARARQAPSPLRFFPSPSSSSTHCLSSANFGNSYRARGARSANQTWKYKLISCWKLRKGPYLNDVYTDGGRGVNEMQT